MSLWDLNSERVTADDATQQLIEEHEDKFRPQFEENYQEDISTHPYKIYRDIVENQELTEDEKAVLKSLKDEYSGKWQNMKEEEVKASQ